jgi:hypothetical protein
MHSYTASIGRHLLWRPAATVLGDVSHGEASLRSL